MHGCYLRDETAWMLHRRDIQEVICSTGGKYGVNQSCDYLIAIIDCLYYYVEDEIDYRYYYVVDEIDFMYYYVVNEIDYIYYYVVKEINYRYYSVFDETDYI